MKVLVYFQPKPGRDTFEGMRLRKNIKGACELNDVKHTSNLLGDYDVAHFISINDRMKINDCIEAGIPTVISALMCESDPACKMLDTKHGRIYLKNKALNVLNKVTLVLVPDKDAKEFLIKEGVTTPIKVVSPGVNLSRFEAINQTENELADRYFSLKESDDSVLVVGDYDDRTQISNVIDIAKKCKTFKFFFIGDAQNRYLLRARKRRAQHKASKNVKFVTSVADDIYRSMMMKTDIYLSLNKRKFNSIQLLEAMAAKSEIVVLSKTLDNPTDLKDIIHIGNTNKEVSGIINSYKDDNFKRNTINAYKYAEDNSLYSVGKQLKEIYTELFINQRSK